MARGLVFDLSWRLTPPRDGKFRNTSLPQQAVEELYSILTSSVDEPDSGAISLIHRDEFARALGLQVVRASPLSLKAAMYEAARNAPLFLDALYGATSQVRAKYPNAQAPTAATINKILDNFGVGYSIDDAADPARLLLREEIELVPVPSTSILDEAHQEFTLAVKRSEDLLAEGKSREAVQEILWLLESVSTAFSGAQVAGTTIKGKYFNDIVAELRKATASSTMKAALGWLRGMHGYLSSPTGGGVRHGRALDLNTLPRHEAELFCNLTRSYISYLLAEYQGLRK